MPDLPSDFVSPHPLMDDAAVPPDAPAVRCQVRRLSRAGAPVWLNDEVARRMADKLDAIRLSPTSWLNWWACAGVGSALLAQRYPQAQPGRVEPVSTLLAPAFDAIHHAAGEAGWRRWLGRWRGPAVRAWLESDTLPEASAQLLWANMALHASSEPDALLGRWLGLLAVDGMLMLSCLGPDTLRELRGLYARLGWPAPTLPFRDMHDIGDALVHAGFADPVMDMERITFTWATPQALLADLRAWGGNVHPRRFAGLRTPRWRAQLERELQALTQPDGRLALTIEVIYGHAIKPPPRARVAAQTNVSLDDMRAMMRQRPPGR